MKECGKKGVWGHNSVYVIDDIVKGLTTMIMKSFLIGYVFFYALMVQKVSGSGKLQVTLHSYVFEYESKRSALTNTAPTNLTVVNLNAEKVFTPEWNLVTGQMDRKKDTVMTSDWPWTVKTTCSAPPQYRFLVCLDYENSYDAENPCSLERIQSEQLRIDRSPFSTAILGRETITFSPILGFLKNGVILLNPIKVNFPSWRGPVRVSVYIRCCGEQDNYKGQCNELLSTTIDTWPNAFIENTVTTIRSVGGRGSLLMSASATCDPTFYGPSCDIYCLVENPSVEHTFCNISTGKKQCLKGWSGTDCQTDIDECQTVTCHNRGTCMNLPGTFVCQCPLGTKGILCEHRTPVCYTKPCQNQGTCFDTPSGSLCMCPTGFDGQWCDEVTDVVTMATYLPDFNTTGTPIYPDDAVAGLMNTKKESTDWRDGYWAIIVGALLCIAVVVSLVLYRNRANKRYKVNAPEPCLPNLQAPTKSRQFNNSVYQISEPGNIIHSNILQNLGHHADDRSDNHEYCNVISWRSLDPADTGSHHSDVADVRYSLQPVFMENPIFENGKVKNINIDRENEYKENNDNGKVAENGKQLAKKPMFPPKFPKTQVNAEVKDCGFQDSTDNADVNVSRENSLYTSPRFESVLETPRQDEQPSRESNFGESLTENTYEDVHTRPMKPPPTKPKPLPRSIYKVTGRYAQGGNCQDPESSRHIPLDEDGYLVPVIEQTTTESRLQSSSGLTDRSLDSERISGNHRETVYVQYSPEMERSPTKSQQIENPTGNDENFIEEDPVYSFPTNNRPSVKLGNHSPYANVGNSPESLFVASDDVYLEPACCHDNDTQQSIYANMTDFSHNRDSDDGGYVNYSDVKTEQEYWDHE
ncbi:hypothetical protein Btru_036715 [Bulinus truncatus]|nr:hypothetical protein Btru_036715 [Bulinus truncatus]